MRSANKVASPSPRRIVLVVDDDSRMRESLQSLFNSAKVDIRICGNGQDALQLLQSEPVGCVVVDIYMDGLNGWQLQQMIAKSHPKVPIILMTAHLDNDMRTRALSLGACAFLFKPFDGEHLLALVMNAMALGANSLSAAY